MTAFALWLLRISSRLPLGLVRAVGAAVGMLLYFVAGERRRITRVNLRLCFPHWSEAERRRVARAHFRLFTQAILDRGRLWWGSAEDIRAHVAQVGLAHFTDAIAEHPVILLAPHFVGIDAGGMVLGLDWHVVTMYSKQKNKAFDAAVLAGRGRFNDPILLSRQDGIRPAIRAMRNKSPFYFLPDMDLGPREAVFVPFFGISAATVTSVARIARMTDAVVVPCVTKLTREGYVATFYPAWTDFPGDDDVAATTVMNRFIEERVLEMPEQYLWTHKRFKTRPSGESSYYD